ncbi:dermonecrotic toxin domain-containing protein [Pseudomonas putida]|uniref:dermonecrotic toxin domain-containing protein n=1 Tax=Pseudomonas putida TaxID=303 RepID=UPI0023656285|nr:DUF6543 domain-containing protein [Pseudomonas putida]MDD2048269.1 hypothetical protein [Pseudomonas putida]
MSLQERLALNTDLDCAVASHFNLRPTLFEVCARLLVEQWSARQISHHDPQLLYLISLDSTPDRTYVRPLYQALAERFCRRSTLNLTTAEDFLSLSEDADPQGAIAIDLHTVEQLINDCGPLLLECYQGALVTFWSEADPSGVTPWQWYADYLKQHFKSAIDSGFDAGTLNQTTAAMASLIYNYPTAQERTAWPNASNLDVLQLELDTSASAYLDVDLASALLLEHLDSTPQRSVTLIYTTSGQLVPIASRQALFDGLGRLWPISSALRPTLQLTHTTTDNFEAQAQGVLHQQLRAINALAQQYQSEYSAPLMSLELDRLTSMVDLCSAAEQKHRKQLFAHLPEWLRETKGPLMRRYGAMLLDMAQCYEDAAGQFWLDGIDDAETFSYQQLARQIAIDHPGNELAVRDVVIINHQVEAAAIPHQGSLIVDGTVHPVRFSLAQLAIGNLGLLAPGRVELTSASAQPLPTWLDERYLRELISRVDIGTAYPQMLRHNMLDDADQRQLRLRLFDSQLRAQLPAFALELHLHDNRLSEAAVNGISQVMQVLPQSTPAVWAIRPMGLISSPGATSDLLFNTWLIEAHNPATGPCVLYRPLHPEPLLEFTDRLALLVAISNPGALQDDLIQRLPERSRRIYAHGGFKEPHLFHSTEDDFGLPFGTPAPVTLSVEAPLSSIGATLYQACVEETIKHFKAQSASTSQTRWERWQTLGWLLLNTLLPLAGGTLANAVWLVQMSIALVDFVNADSQSDPAGRRINLINLLVNVAVLLFSHAYQGLSLDSPEVQPPPATPPAPPPTPLMPTRIVQPPLEFNWARPNQTLNATQRTTLKKLQANIPLSQLHSPVPSGPLRGLYLYNDQLWASLDNQVYRVEIDPQHELPRIVGASSTDEPGPWLTRDEAGRWRIDLALRLRAGMPLSKQLELRKQERVQAVSALRTQLMSDVEQIRSQKTTREQVMTMAATASDERLLRSCLDKTQAYARFWAEHLNTLEASNHNEPVKQFKVVRATALYELISCEKSSYGSLKKLFRPLRSQMVALVNQTPELETIPAADRHISKERLDNMTSLLDQLITCAETLNDARGQLNRLASRQQAKITELNNWVQANRETDSEHLMWRFMRGEINFNRLSLLYPLDDLGNYWLDRAWKNLNLGIAQRLRLANLEQPTVELKVRVLRSIEQQLNATLRQLNNLQPLLEQPASLAALAELIGDVQQIADGVHHDLADFPDYPPNSTVKQLRSQAPGLIETTESGLLLAEPRVDNDSLVDIPGPDNKTPSRTYRRDQDEWVEVPSATPEPSQGPSQSLKSVLKQSRTRMSSARGTLHSLQATRSENYLPVEIEEMLDHQQALLTTQRQAIEQCLTEVNQTDEAARSEDAALVIGSLDELAQTLKDQALELRTQAALRQKPRMGEVQYLIDHDQVQVRSAGPRRRLAKTKGRADDFLDEYEISYQDRGLWYAHFHYPAMDTPRESFIAGHLKSAAQRHTAGASITDPHSGKTIDVYRAPITLVSAEKYFFGL